MTPKNERVADEKFCDSFLFSQSCTFLAKFHEKSMILLFIIDSNFYWCFVRGFFFINRWWLCLFLNKVEWENIKFEDLYFECFRILTNQIIVNLNYWILVNQFMPISDYDNVKEVAISRDELYDLVWSERLSDISKKYYISENGLIKKCREWNIPMPNLKYWIIMPHHTNL